MDPLKRDNLGVQGTNHEDRIQALERRIFLQPTVWAYAALTTPQTITALSSENLAFDDFWTGDSAIFRTTTNTAGDTQILCNEFGVYVVTSSVEWEDIGIDYSHSHRIDESRLIGANLGAFGAAAATASFTEWNGGGGPAPLDTGDVSIGVHSPWDYLSTQPAGWQLLASNAHSADVDVLRASIMIALLPSDEKEQDYVVF